MTVGVFTQCSPMYEPTYVAFCDNVLTNYVGNFFTEPCGMVGWDVIGPGNTIKN